MSMEMPYFMTNPKWYKEEYNEKEGYTIYKPTKDAPQKAIESMEKYNQEAINGGATKYPNDKDFYFKKNPAWYTFDEKEKMNIITKDAPEEARNSYWKYISQAKIVQY